MQEGMACVAFSDVSLSRCSDTTWHRRGGHCRPVSKRAIWRNQTAGTNSSYLHMCGWLSCESFSIPLRLCLDDDLQEVVTRSQLAHYHFLYLWLLTGSEYVNYLETGTPRTLLVPIYISKSCSFRSAVVVDHYELWRGTSSVHFGLTAERERERELMNNLIAALTLPYPRDKIQNFFSWFNQFRLLSSWMNVEMML